MFRTFKVGIQTESKKEISYFVTDATNDSEIRDRPKAAEFPISQVFDKELQHRRVTDYCAYLNKLAEASKQAYEENQLINVLKS